MVVRMQNQQISEIATWSAMQDVEVSRPGAIHRPVKIELKAKWT